MNKILIIIYFMKTHCNHYTILCRQLVRVLELTQCPKGHFFHSITKKIVGSALLIANMPRNTPVT